MKKFIVLVLCLLVLGTSAFAMDMAAGGGGLVWHAFAEGESLTAFGAFGFFGLGRYVELNAAVLHLSADAVSVTGIAAGAYGKYPISLSDNVVVFPTAGLDVETYFSESSITAVWLRGGMGIDYFFTDRVFLRGHLIYGVYLANNIGAEGTKPHGILAKVGVGYMF
jgi:hypothetical protein